LLLFTLTVVVPSVYARPTATFIDGVQGEAITRQKDNVIYHGYRFLNPNGQPNHGHFMLFLHGLDSNLHGFEYSVKWAMALGFDCYSFNFRGHGNGDEKSVVLNYHDGDYRFRKMAEEDFPLFLEIAHEMSGQTGYVVGHSMGGMVPRASIALGLVDQSLIDGMVLIGSPPHFRNDSLGFLPAGLSQWVSTPIQSGRGDEMFSAFEKIETLNAFNPFYWMMQNTWAARAHTRAIPKDILRSFMDFRKEYPYEDVHLAMPALYVIGENDMLVRASDIVETATKQSGEAGYWTITLKGVGHLSLVAPGAIESYGATLKKFLTAPASLGPANSTHIRTAPESCTRLLLGA
jgi:pimeloyl-ACP methyl ester carboxylesterase